jgi:hypothetical protein
MTEIKLSMGNWLKDGVRYHLVWKEDVDEEVRAQEAAAAGYQLSPLTPRQKSDIALNDLAMKSLLSATEAARFPVLDYAPFWIMLSKIQKNGQPVDELIRAYHSGLPSGQMKKELGYWLDNSRYVRNHPILVGMASHLGISPEEIDDAWGIANAG